MSKNNDNICPICLDILTDTNIITRTICNHLFHTKCLNLNKKYNNQCPTCRTQFAPPIKNMDKNNEIHIPFIIEVMIIEVWSMIFFCGIIYYDIR
jgi:hypothetical protein